MSKYPEHEKLTEVKEQSQAIGEFLVWLEDEKGYDIPYVERVEQLLSEFFEVDLKKLEEEKRMMLDALQQENATIEKENAFRAKGFYLSRLGGTGGGWIGCDAKCHKAWGINDRPKYHFDEENDYDDYAYLTDHELGVSGNPQIPEGEFPHKWCHRECERSKYFAKGDVLELDDFSKRVYNIPSRHRTANTVER